jgi:hypothetical protein
MNMIEVLHTHFPGAKTIKQVFAEVERVLQPMGITPSHVLPAKATCRDDSIEELSHELHEHGYHALFRMEALAAIPSYGSAGVGAFYHHIPDRGVGLIFFGPHIGIDSEGRVGYLDRRGKEEAGKSCGASWGLLSKWQAGETGPFQENPELSEMARVYEPFRAAILDSPQPLLALTEAEYGHGLERLTHYITCIQKSEKSHFPVVLVAGINLDLKHDDSNRFQLRTIRVFQQGKLTNEEKYWQHDRH